MKLFSEAMEYLKIAGDQDLSFIVNGFDWAALGGGPVVELDGGNGHIAIPAAKAFTRLQFIIEEPPSNAEPVKAATQSDLPSRVSFPEHHYFKPPPVADAKAYFALRVFHDWLDEDCVRIIK